MGSKTLSDIVNGVIKALLVAAIVGIFQTYVEVKIIQRDIKELRHDLDTLYGMTNDEIQKR